LLLAVAGGLAYLFEVQGKISDYLKLSGSRRAISFVPMAAWAEPAALEPTQSALCRGLLIALVPVLLLVLLAVRSAGILYSQLAPSSL